VYSVYGIFLILHCLYRPIIAESALMLGEKVTQNKQCQVIGLVELIENGDLERILLFDSVHDDELSTHTFIELNVTG